VSKDKAARMGVEQGSEYDVTVVCFNLSFSSSKPRCFLAIDVNGSG
jgi:hypothetical protein